MLPEWDEYTAEDLVQIRFSLHSVSESVVACGGLSTGDIPFTGEIRQGNVIEIF